MWEWMQSTREKVKRRKKRNGEDLKNPIAYRVGIEKGKPATKSCRTDMEESKMIVLQTLIESFMAEQLIAVLKVAESS